ncbi:MAG: DUF1727 domain-containing protein [Clostridiales bacterium]|nr:DUF1727 domain-containing protein [Clostridiales bacterium]
MRKAITILVCKLAYLVGRLLGAGSVLPGKIALKLYPDILSKIKYPKRIIGVTGSNGKTSTAAMIAYILDKYGMRVVYNREGSNMTAGICTMLLSNCDVKGRVQGDVIVVEIDERYAPISLKYIRPTHFVVTNLYRDQLTRNGHSELIYNIIKDAITDDKVLILNADDPLTSLYGFVKGEGGALIPRDNTVFFSLEKNKYSTDECVGTYDDMRYCPNCKARLHREYFNMASLGGFECPNCGHKTQGAKYLASSPDLEAQEFNINGRKIKMSFGGYYFIYNFLAAYSACELMGVPEDFIAEAMSEFVLRTGRIVRFTQGRHKGLLLLSKHENSVSYDQSLAYVARQNKTCDVVIIVDEISRKYYTADTSWLWDVNFELLNAPHVEKIYIAGKYCHDLAVRMGYSTIPREKIIMRREVEEILGCIHSDKGDNDIYVITCFTDKEKFMSAVDVSREDGRAR